MNVSAYAEVRPSRRRVVTYAVVAAVAAILLFALVFATPIITFFAKGGAAQFAQPPATVATITARATEWNPQSEVVGSLAPMQGADLAVEVAGTVDRIYFESGSDVRAGQPLVKLRDEDDVARLRTLEATAELAAATYARQQKLFQIQGTSQADLEAAAANLKSARAAVAQQAALVGKKTLRAPFAGRLGIRDVNVGQYVNAGTPVVTLQALDPLNLDFHVPQQALNTIKVGQTIDVTVDAFPGEHFAGRVAAINPKVELGTRNIAVRAVIPNRQHKLLPGMYATAEIETGAPQRLVTIPQSAVTFNPYGSTVYRVVEKTENGKKSLVAQQTFVTTGATRGDQIAILSGLKEGEAVITAGQIKVQNGAAVVVNNAIQPSNDPNPTPVER